MNQQVLKYVTRERASLLLGIPELELSRISDETGLGYTELEGGKEQTFFTYGELSKICQLCAPHVH